MISCIVLAAGLSSRFQTHKALAEIQGTTVINHLQKMLLETRVNEVVIVLGHAQELIKPHLLKHSRIRVVYNKDYNFGQTSSFQAGLSSVTRSSHGGTFLIPVDYPCIKSETVDMLMDATASLNKKTILIPTFEGKKGHPPYFASSLFQEFLELDHHEGLNTISHRHTQHVELIKVNDPGVIQTFNTVEELEEIKKSLGVY